jgi:hypothetical protein
MTHDDSQATENYSGRVRGSPLFPCRLPSGRESLAKVVCGTSERLVRQTAVAGGE